MIAASGSIEPKTNILVVEDEGIVALDIVHNLRDLGFEISGVATSSEEAERLSEEHVPDLVLMDIRIRGDVDGIATGALLSHRFGVPIIYLTAHADDDTMARAKRTSPVGYILKPFKKQDLYTAIELALYRHDLEKRLREREQLLATTLKSIDDAVFTTDGDGNVAFINPSGEALIGWSLADAVGKPLADFLRLSDAQTGEPVVLDVRDVLDNCVVHKMAAARLTTREGEHRLVQHSLAPVSDGDTVHGVVMVLQDRTEVAVLEEQLEVADHLVSLGTLAAGVAHEINNPLAYVLSNLQFAIEGLRDEKPTAGGCVELQQALVEASDGVKRIARIVADLKRLSRQDDVVGDCDPISVLDWALGVTAHQWRSHARVERHVDATPRVQIDATRLGQVLVNLLVNAAQSFMTGATGSTPATNVIRVSIHQASERVVIEVRDSGRGIDPADRSRIFAPFFTTKPIGTGTGLGLSICHRIVVDVGGTIEIDSEVGVGTTCRILLPPSESSFHEPPTPAASLLPSVQRARVLIIDDDRLIRSALERQLKRQNEVTCVSRARAALALIESGSQFDVILCDLMMPEMSGMAFYEVLVDDRPQLARRVVFLTGGAYTQDAATFLEEVDNYSLEKPFSMKELETVITRAQSRR